MVKPASIAVAGRDKHRHGRRCTHGTSGQRPPTTLSCSKPMHDDGRSTASVARPDPHRGGPRRIDEHLGRRRSLQRLGGREGDVDTAHGHRHLTFHHHHLRRDPPIDSLGQLLHRGGVRYL